MPALWEECCDGNVAGVLAALERGERVDTMPCLMLAADQGHGEVVSLLLERGAAVNAVDTKEWTALHWASSNGKAGAVRILLAQPGVDCNPRNKNGATPLMVAVACGKAECVRVMVRDRRVELDTVANSGTTLEDRAR